MTKINHILHTLRNLPNIILKVQKSNAGLYLKYLLYLNTFNMKNILIYVNTYSYVYICKKTVHGVLNISNTCKITVHTVHSV